MALQIVQRSVMPRSKNLIQNRRMLLTLPNLEEQLYKPSIKEVSFTADVGSHSIPAFSILSKHFPRAWGFLWALKENSLSSTLVGLSSSERKNVYRQLARRDCSHLRSSVSRIESSDVLDGLLIVGGESGKSIISEAYKTVGLPPHVTFKSDLAYLDLKDKVPMAWVVNDAPVTFNIHPAPPELPGGGCYVPSLLAGGEKEHGVTLHFVNNNIDDGQIINVKRFRIPEGCTLSSLEKITARYCLEMLEELLLLMKFTEPLSDMATTCHYQWGADEFTRKMTRNMLQEAKRKYGEKGHPALL